MMKKQFYILLIGLIPQFQLVCQTYVYSTDEINTLNDSIENLGISCKITPEDFGSRAFDQVKSIRVDAKNFETTRILSFTPNINNLVIESNRIDFFDWKDLPSGITSLKLGALPDKMKHFEPSYLPKNLKEIHLRGKWSNQQLQSLLEANTHVEKLILEELELNEFPIAIKTVNYLGLVGMDLAKSIVFNDLPSLNILFIDECQSLDMVFIQRMGGISEITIQGSKIQNQEYLKNAMFLKELTIRNSEFKHRVISISNNSLLKLRLTNINLHEVSLNTSALKQLDLSNNGKITLNGLAHYSNQLTHFYAYETSLVNVDLMDYSFRSLSFFGGLENINRKTLPNGFIEYACSTCTGTLKRVPNDW